MREFVNQILDSMVEHEPQRLPFAKTLRITENSVAGAPNMLSSWRNIDGVNAIGDIVEDVQRQTLFFTASIDMGGHSAMFWVRVHFAEEEIDELEISIVPSRAHGGFVMLADDVTERPSTWSQEVPVEQRATRDELEALARAVYDNTLPVPEPSEQSLLMELGGIVYEDPDYIDLLMEGKIQEHESSENVAIPAGLGPDRPTDPRARVVAVDEEQGIVVVSGIVPGFVSPYVIRSTTESCFVPETMIGMHLRTLETGWIEARRTIEQMPAVSIGSQLLRMFDGKLQGIHLLNCLAAPGAQSPWVGEAA